MVKIFESLATTLTCRLITVRDEWSSWSRNPSNTCVQKRQTPITCFTSWRSCTPRISGQRTYALLYRLFLVYFLKHRDLNYSCALAVYVCNACMWATGCCYNGPEVSHRKQSCSLFATKNVFINNYGMHAQLGYVYTVLREQIKLVV